MRDWKWERERAVLSTSSNINACRRRASCPCGFVNVTWKFYAHNLCLYECCAERIFGFFSLIHSCSHINLVVIFVVAQALCQSKIIVCTSCTFFRILSVKNYKNIKPRSKKFFLEKANKNYFAIFMLNALSSFAITAEKEYKNINCENCESFHIHNAEFPSTLTL